MESFATILKKLRESKGLSQQELAEKMGIPSSTIARIETNAQGMTSKNLTRLCNALEIKMDFIPAVERIEPSSVGEVAHYVLKKGAELLEEAYDITNMKLNKLLYYCQMYSIGQLNTKLFHEPLYAWKHGPVSKEIYHAYKDKENPSRTLTIQKNDSTNLNEQQKSIIDQVLKRYAKYSAYELREMTHREIPWKNAFSREGNKRILEKDMNHQYSLIL